MEPITCPNCGRIIERQHSATQDPFSVWCPKCGEVPLLEDSQVITISDGHLGGPGVSHLQEDEEDLKIYEGVISSYEEEDIVANHEGWISFDVPSPSAMPNATVETKENFVWKDENQQEEKPQFEWKAESKEVGHAFVASGSKANNVGLPKPAATTPDMESQSYRSKRKPGARKTTDYQLRKTQRRRVVKPSVSSPWYYYALFYGVSITIILVFVFYACYRALLSKMFNPPARVVIGVGAKEIWRKAEDNYAEADVNYREAHLSRDRQNREQYRQKLLQAQTLCSKALEMGKQSWEEQIKLLMEQKKISRSAAETFAQERYTTYRQKMQEWRQTFTAIHDELKALQK